MAPCMRGKTFKAGTLRPGGIPLGVSPNLAPPIRVDQVPVDMGGLHTVVVPVLILSDLDQITIPLWAL